MFYKILNHSIVEVSRNIQKAIKKVDFIKCVLLDLISFILIENFQNK